MATNAPQQGTSSGGASGAPHSQEFVVRVPKDVKKKYSIFQFNASNNVDFTKSGPTKVERENNLREFKLSHGIDQMPKFGAGSEFGREQKEEARRKKYGIMKRRYNPEAQPWLMKMGAGKQIRKFKGTKNGGVMENSSFYIFTQCADGAFDAFPIEDWYNFTPIIKYKYLNSEEAEEEYLRRDRTLNFFNLMLKKRLKNDVEDVDDEDDEDKKKSSKKSKSKGLMLTEMEDWADFSDENSGDDSDDGEKRRSKKKQKLIEDDELKKKKKKSRKANSDDEAMEESDSMDEGQEIDYMSDSGDSNDEGMYDEKDLDEDKYGEKGVADEDGLRKLVDSDEEDEEEEDEKKKKKLEEEGQEKDAKNKKKDDDDSDSDSSSSSGSESDPDKEEIKSALFMQKKGGKKKLLARRESASSEGSAPNSRSATPTIIGDLVDKAKKRPDSPSQAAKKMKLDPSTASSSTSALASSANDGGITEEAVRRYLMRKPMTTTDLVHKFKTKNTGLTKDQQVKTIAQILKRLNPEKRQRQDKLYLFIKKQ